MNTWKDFERDAKAVEKATKDEALEIVQLLQDAFSLFADAFSVGETSDTTDATLAKMSILSKKQVLHLTAFPLRSKAAGEFGNVQICARKEYRFGVVSALLF
jgi:hypothetical protein